GGRRAPVRRRAGARAARGGGAVGGGQLRRRRPRSRVGAAAGRGARRARGGGDGSADLDAALRLYRGRHYDEGAAAFAGLAQSEPDAGRAAVLHANAGTAAARAEQWGEAVWHLRRARLLVPRDDVAATNLARIRAVLGEGTSEATHFTESVRELP